MMTVQFDQDLNTFKYHNINLYNLLFTGNITGRYLLLPPCNWRQYQPGDPQYEGAYWHMFNQLEENDRIVFDNDDSEYQVMHAKNLYHRADHTTPIYMTYWKGNTDLVAYEPMKCAMYICCRQAARNSTKYEVRVCFGMGYGAIGYGHLIAPYDNWVSYYNSNWWENEGAYDGWAGPYPTYNGGGPGVMNGSYRVIMEFEEFSTENATAHWNAIKDDIYNSVRFPRWIETGIIWYNYFNHPEYDKFEAWLQNNAGWEEEDLPVDTRWNKPKSALNLLHAYDLDDTDQTNLKRDLWGADSSSGVFSSGLYNDPMQAILGLHFIPFELPAENKGGSRTDVAVGKKKFMGPTDGERGVYPLTDEYAEYEFGSQVINRIYNDYRDYTEVTIQLFLPTIGWKTLDAQTYMGKELIIKYRVNFLTGDVMALLITNPGNIIQDTVKGVCSQPLPLSGADFARLLQAKTTDMTMAIAGVIGAAGGVAQIAAGSAGGNPMAIAGGLSSLAGTAGNLASGIPSVKAQATQAQNSIQKNGNLGSSAGFLSYPNAYIVISYHEDAMPTRYQNYEGYQSNKILTITNLTGYIKAREVYFSSARATEQEKTMVEQMLKEGVFK